MTGAIEAELAAAQQARAAGQEGRARVCARRAAGLALRAYYQRRPAAGAAAWGGDALAQLHRLRADADAPAAVRAMAERLTTVVDFDHQLPFAEDPLADAAALVRFAAGVTPAAGGESEP